MMMNRFVTVSLLTMVAAAGAQAAIINFATSLGPEAVGASGTGSASFVFDTTAQTLSIDANWSGLSGITTVSHIHCCVTTAGTGTAGVAVTPTTLPGFPSGVSSGSYSVLLDMTQTTSYTATFLNGPGGGTAAGASAAILQNMIDGKTYLNIHTNLFPSGEIRGFIAPVPEPGTFALAGLALAALIGTRRFKS